MKTEETPITAAEPVSAVSPPTHLKAVDPNAHRIRVVDAGTGKAIKHVIEADAEAGKLVRYEVVGGNFVRNGDSLATIAEDRAIRLEWVDA